MKDIHDLTDVELSYILAASVDQAMIARRNGDSISAQKLLVVVRKVAEIKRCGQGALDEEQLFWIGQALIESANRREVLFRKDAHIMRETADKVERIKRFREEQWIANYFRKGQIA